MAIPFVSLLAPLVKTLAVDLGRAAVRGLSKLVTGDADGEASGPLPHSEVERQQRIAHQFDHLGPGKAPTPKPQPDSCEPGSLPPRR